MRYQGFLRKWMSNHYYLKALLWACILLPQVGKRPLVEIVSRLRKINKKSQLYTSQVDPKRIAAISQRVAGLVGRRNCLFIALVCFKLLGDLGFNPILNVGVLTRERRIAHAWVEIDGNDSFCIIERKTPFCVIQSFEFHG